MGTPFVGEIRLMSFGFAPKGWAPCDGQLFPIHKWALLYSILGTRYGGDGQVTFALPDLRGRVAIHRGPGFTVGQKGGEELHTLTTPELPQHTHSWTVRDAAADSGTAAVPPTGNFFGRAFAAAAGGAQNPVNRFSTAAPSGMLKAGTITSVGGGHPHENRQPYATSNFCIALIGLPPPQN